MAEQTFSTGSRSVAGGKGDLAVVLQPFEKGERVSERLWRRGPVGSCRRSDARTLGHRPQHRGHHPETSNENGAVKAPFSARYEPGG